MVLPELLAPAGTWDALRAAVANGADAVYFGVEALNARMRAANFRREELPELMDWLHRRGVKGFLTVNVLVFPDEVEEAGRLVLAAAAAGVDALIVQDIGLARLARTLAPELAIHGSTQMSITSAAGVAQASPHLNELTEAERAWLPRWDRELAAWEPVLREAVGLWLLRPRSWTLPRRWRFQAEARQRRAGGGWLAPARLEALVRASLHALPPGLYQDPLLGPLAVWGQSTGGASPTRNGGGPVDVPPGSLPLLGAVELDGRRRVCRSWRRGAQASASSASSAIG